MHERCLLPAREDIEFVSKCAKGKKYISFYNEGRNSIKPIKLSLALGTHMLLLLHGAKEFPDRKRDSVTGEVIRINKTTSLPDIGGSQVVKRQRRLSPSSFRLQHCLVDGWGWTLTTLYFMVMDEMIATPKFVFCP